MTVNAPTPSPTAQLLQYRSQLILHQAIAAVAKFGVADLLERGIHATSALAQELGLNEDALYRTLRALAAQGIFEEPLPARSATLRSPILSARMPRNPSALSSSSVAPNSVPGHSRNLLTAFRPASPPATCSPAWTPFNISRRIPNSPKFSTTP
jgi:hypothetical protein